MKGAPFEAERCPAVAHAPLPGAQRPEVLCRLRHNGLRQRDDDAPHKRPIHRNVQEHLGAFGVVELQGPGWKNHAIRAQGGQRRLKSIAHGVVFVVFVVQGLRFAFV